MIDVILEVYRSENQLFWNEYHIWIFWEKALPIRIEKNPFRFADLDKRMKFLKCAELQNKYWQWIGLRLLKYDKCHFIRLNSSGILQKKAPKTIINGCLCTKYSLVCKQLSAKSWSFCKIRYFALTSFLKL